MVSCVFFLFHLLESLTLLSTKKGAVKSWKTPWMPREFFTAGRGLFVLFCLTAPFSCFWSSLLSTMLVQLFFKSCVPSPFFLEDCCTNILFCSNTEKNNAPNSVRVYRITICISRETLKKCLSVCFLLASRKHTCVHFRIACTDWQRVHEQRCSKWKQTNKVINKICQTTNEWKTSRKNALRGRNLEGMLSRNAEQKQRVSDKPWQNR